MIKQGDKFIAYEDSVGNSSMFWVNTLSFKIGGSFKKGDIVEMKEFVLESSKVTLEVERVETVLDVPVEEVIVPVSAVGLDRDIILMEHEDIIHSLTDVNNENRVFLILLQIPVSKRRKIRIPLGDTGNILEYTYEGL